MEKDRNLLNIQNRAAQAIEEKSAQDEEADETCSTHREERDSSRSERF
jgi:hypothetical protein